jgi:putative peptidoglycan lipid II flippase
VYMFVLRGFYAHQDTRTPFIVNLVENALNIVFAFVLVGRYGVLGLGLAFALAYLLSAAWVLRILSYKVPGFPLRYVALNIARMGLAALLMAEIVWLVSRHVGGTTGAGALARVTVGGIVGMAAYVGILVLLRAPELARVHQLTVRLRPASK